MYDIENNETVISNDDITRHDKNDLMDNLETMPRARLIEEIYDLRMECDFLRSVAYRNGIDLDSLADANMREEFIDMIRDM